MLYLDHAATSYPKPESVLAAMTHWYRDLGVSSSRGSSHRCTEVAQLVQRARRGLATMCGVAASRVAFTSGATESINLFLRAFLRPGDAVLTTAFEHSSVARPLVALQRERALSLTVLPPDADGGIAPASVQRALLHARPRLFVFTHASNVTGALFDAAAFGELARAHGATTLLDASQTAGQVPIGGFTDAIALSAHKALLGPPGLGALCVREGLELEPQKQGGTGTSQALEMHPVEWPLAFEAGTPNTPAVCGLDAALGLLTPAHQRERYTAALLATLAFESELRENPRVRIITPTSVRIPVLSFVHADLDAADVGAILDALDIHVRTGHHCAPWLHRHLGTTAAGTVRVSPGPFVTADDIRRVSAALAS
jgi:selenocysteine lyase/cysteine desulfurase